MLDLISQVTYLLSIFKHWHFTDLFTLKVDFAPVDTLEPLLCVSLSGEQSDCEEVDSCLPEVSGSLSLISPFLFFSQWFFLVGFLIKFRLSLIACSPSCVCGCACTWERGKQRRRQRVNLFLSCVDRLILPQLSGFKPVCSTAGKWEKLQLGREGEPDLVGTRLKGACVLPLAQQQAAW